MKKGEEAKAFYQKALEIKPDLQRYIRKKN